jgi:FkbM family methyltransferase
VSLTDYLRYPERITRKLMWWVLYHGTRKEVTLATDNGLLTFSSRDRIIGKHLYVRRAYESQFIESALNLLRSEGHVQGSGTLLDVGANIGMISIALLLRGACSRAVAIEPSPVNFRLLQRNVAQNGLGDRFHCVQAALTDAAGVLDLELSDSNSGDNRIRVPGVASGVDAFGERSRDVIRVPARTLDEMVSSDPWLSPEELAFVWIDIQGLEAQCFAGGSRTLSHGVPVVTEFWPYGIARSGMQPEGYMSVVRRLFTHYYDLGEADRGPLPIDGLIQMFHRFQAPSDNRQLLLVRRADQFSPRRTRS